MGKVAQNSVKYVIEAQLDSSGMVEKPDVVGAIFGQTEGLLSEDLDLRQLQERGRIGRIEVKVKDQNGSSKATIKIPSSLDATDTALIAASLETIERVGPTDANIKVKEIRDERVSKRDYIKKRAKQLLEDLNENSPDHGKITEEIKEDIRQREITEYKGFKAGPEADKADEIILVEGRADLLNLLKHGVKNTLAIGGTSIPDELENAVENKEITAFLDGDRGGKLILKELKEKLDPDHIAKAPKNNEVEELTKEQIYAQLRDKEPVKYVETEIKEKQGNENISKDELIEFLDELVGTRAVHVLDEDLNIKNRIPVEKINEIENECYALVLDGEIDREKIKKAEELGAKYIAGMSKSGHATSSNLTLITKNETVSA